LTTTPRHFMTILCLALAMSLIATQSIGSTLLPASMADSTPHSSTSSEFFAGESFAPEIKPVVGVIRVLVLAVSFQDVSPSMSISELRQEWFGTVPAYYHEVSYGKLTIQGDVYGWYKLPHPESYYGRDCHAINDADCSGTNQSWKIANDAIPLVEKDVNFTNYDYYVFLHAGTGQETSQNKNDIWSVTYLDGSVQTPTKTLTRFNIVPELEAPPNAPNGVWCVEFAHNLGVPDLYDTTNGPNNGKPILGPWELMDKGSWNGDPPGSLPAHMTAWAKIRLGWISGSMLLTAVAGTTNTIVDPTEVASNQVHAIKIPIGATGNSVQYYLVEVRKHIGFDSALPATGVLITAVNETRTVGIVRVINSDPEVADLENAVWQLGETFTDSLDNLTVTVASESGNSYAITVSIGVNRSPAVSLASTNSTAQILIGGVPLTVVLATTLPDQEKGLSGLPSLPNNEGMLFVFDHEDYWAFWMVNMKFPLDMIWFNSARRVVWTEPNLQPCPPSDCPVIMPNVKSMYVLEVNAGFIAANHITIGTTFSFSNA
jgi:M6 family metalloprotease-like protein